MRYFMVDPDNEERLLKVPPRVVEQIKADERERIRAGVMGLVPFKGATAILTVIDGGEC